MERYIAIDNVCAWPNLTMLPDNSIVATIYNQPSHGRWEGDVVCWRSTDGGHLWHFCGDAAPHEPRTARLNHAAGLAHDGALVVIVSGYSPKPPRGEDAPPEKLCILSPWVCRSYDGGCSWERAETVTFPGGYTQLIPFGDIVRVADSTLAAAFYSSDSRERNDVYLLYSRDDGRTWGDAVPMAGTDYNETALLVLDSGNWLAAARTLRDSHLDLFISDDAGKNWHCQGPLTLPRQHPAHLLQLADGRVLLTYGIRNRGLYGVGARLSEDRGETWGAPIVLVHMGVATDGGYPSSVQLANGLIVTAYYSNRIEAHQRYHMGILRWQAEQ